MCRKEMLQDPSALDCSSNVGVVPTQSGTTQAVTAQETFSGSLPPRSLGAFVPARRHVRLELREIASEPKAVQSGEASAVWRYDPEQRRLVVDLHETASSQVINLSME